MFMNGSAIHFYDVRLVLGTLQEVHTRADISVQIALNHAHACVIHMMMTITIKMMYCP